MNHLEGAERIGAKAWDRLVGRYGGCELAVPANIDSGSGRKLAELIGEEPARKLIQYAGGDNLYIAAGWERIVGARYREIIERRQQGESYTDIALGYTYVGRYSERNIRMICTGSRNRVIEAMERMERQLELDLRF